MIGNTLQTLTGVYHADGSLIGELRYLAGKFMGTTHCGLCDITHRGVRLRTAFKDSRDRWSVPFHLVHLDERTDEVAEFTGGRTPCVVAHTSQGLIMLLDSTALDACSSDVAVFQRRLDEAIDTHSIRIPSL